MGNRQVNELPQDAARRTLDDGVSLEDAVLGVGYALLALRDVVQQSLKAEPEGAQVRHQVLQEEPQDGGSVMPLAEQLARGILERQLARGDATVGWDDRGESRRVRVDVAGVILSQNLLDRPSGEGADVLARRYGFGTTVALQILEDAWAVRDAWADVLADSAADDAAQTRDDQERQERQMRTLLLQAGWTPDGPEEDGPASWSFNVIGVHNTFGWRRAEDAVRVISAEGRGVRVMDGVAPEEIRAKADALLHGHGYVVGGRRVAPEAVYVFRSAPAGILTS